MMQGESEQYDCQVRNKPPKFDLHTLDRRYGGPPEQYGGPAVVEGGPPPGTPEYVDWASQVKMTYQ